MDTDRVIESWLLIRVCDGCNFEMPTGKSKSNHIQHRSLVDPGIIKLFGLAQKHSRYQEDDDDKYRENYLKGWFIESLFHGNT